MQFTQTLKEDFLCKVCKEAWDPDAVVQCADCQTIFCKPCYDEAMMKDNTCHACSKSPATFVAVHRLVRSMAENLQVYCKYRCHGCGWTGTRTEFKTHSDGCVKKPREFSYVNEDAIPKELLCPVCVLPFRDPVQLPCEHIYCRECATDSLRRNGLCPVDRSPATADSFVAPPRLIAEMLDELQVYCANRKAVPNPCAWAGRRRDYIGHKAVCVGGKPTGGDLIAFPAPIATAVTAGSDATMQITPFTEFPTIEATNISQDLYALAHITAPKMESVEQRKKPLSISAVLDVSGSMSGGKLRMAIDSLKFMIDELSDRDELGIITFHTDIAEPFTLSKMTDEGKQRAHRAADSLRAQNCTNLSGGLFAGMDQVCRKPFTAQNAVDYNRQRKTKKMPARNSFTAGASDLFSRMMGATPAATFSPTPAKISTWCMALKRDNKKVYTTGVTITGPQSIVQSVSVSVDGDAKCQPQFRDTFDCRFETNCQPAELVVRFGFHSKYEQSDATFKFSAPTEGTSPEHRVTLSQSDSTQPPVAVAATAESDSCRAVLIFTDGAANNGITTEPEFAAALTSRLQTMQDMVIHTFGFGADHNARLLQKLSQIGAGSYYFIQDVNTMKESFADCLGGLLSTVAQNITLEITPQAGFAIDRLLSTLKNEVKDGRAVVTMRDVYSAEQRDVLVKLKMVNPLAVGVTASLVKFTVHYDSLLSGKQESVTAIATAGTAASKSTEPPHKTLDEQRARILAAEALEAARRDADNGDVAGARERLKGKRDEIRACTTAESRYMDAMMDDMDDVFCGLESATTWNQVGSKACAQKATSHQMQRQCDAMDNDSLGYDNSFKKCMRSKARK